MAAEVIRKESGQVELHTPRLLLRGAQESDAEHLHISLSDPEVMRYWSEPPHPNLARTQEWVDSMRRSPSNGTADFIICLKACANNPIGKIGVWQGNEIGFQIQRAHWRQGLALEALHAILPYLFNQRNFEALTADIDPRNAGSKALLARVGFVEESYQERSMRVGEEWVDSLWLRLDSDRWRSLSGA